MVQAVPAGGINITNVGGLDLTHRRSSSSKSQRPAEGTQFFFWWNACRVEVTGSF
jgi:hypothetical protein